MNSEGREGEVGEMLACDIDIGEKGEEWDFLLMSNDLDMLVGRPSS